MIEFNISSEDHGQRLDRFLRKKLHDAPLGYIYKLIRKDVKVNGKRSKPEVFLLEGDVVYLYMTDEEYGKFKDKKTLSVSKSNISVVYEDENALICNKPRGILTHGDSVEKKKTLHNQVLGYLGYNGKGFAPAPVNRLDRNTGGLVIFAKNYQSIKSLNQLIRERKVYKGYRTLVLGNLKSPMSIKDSLLKDESKNIVGLDDSGKYSETRILDSISSNGYSFLDIQLITGRTHQIRVHLANRGFYILGDGKYGNKFENGKLLRKFNFSGQFLYGYRLKFDRIEGDLRSLSEKEFAVDLPKKMEEIKNFYLKI